MDTRSAANLAAALGAALSGLAATALAQQPTPAPQPTYKFEKCTARIMALSIFD